MSGSFRCSRNFGVRSRDGLCSNKRALAFPRSRSVAPKDSQQRGMSNQAGAAWFSRGGSASNSGAAQQRLLSTADSNRRRSSQSCSCSGSEVLGREGEEFKVDEKGPELSDVLAALKSRYEDGAGKGQVYLVGTGPGDPGYLTLKAVELMKTADVVLYDRLVSDEILEYVHDGAIMIYVGKSKGYHTRSQEEIHELLLQFAGCGAHVLRLKGGDPIVFGRGGEEMDFLRQRGVRVQIVSGITAASGIGSELGIPLTHRGLSNSVTFLTGHSRDGGFDPADEIAMHAKADTTLVVYMGLGALPTLAMTLQVNGLKPSTPAVAVMKGTTAEQRAVFAPLGDLPQAVEAAALSSPTLMIIGPVVSLSPLWPGEGDCVDLDKRAIGSLMAGNPSLSQIQTGDGTRSKEAEGGALL